MTTNKLIQSRERLAKLVIERANAITVKLNDLAPLLKQLWREFKNLKDGETIMGCRNKKEFCQKRLNHTPRAVQYMLAGGNKNRKPARKSRENVSRPNGQDSEREESEPEEADAPPEDFEHGADAKARARSVLMQLEALRNFVGCTPATLVEQLTKGELGRLYSALLELMPWLKGFWPTKKPAAPVQTNHANIQARHERRKEIAQ